MRGVRCAGILLEDFMIFIVSGMGTFVNSDSTSKLTRMSLGCTWICCIFSTKSFEFRMREWELLRSGFSSDVKYRPSLYVGELIALTIGLKGTLVLWILGRP